MVKQLFLLLITLSSFTLLCTQVQAQELSAFVDRNEITLNQTVTLTVRIDAALGDVEPSFRGLNNDFEQVGLSKSNSYTNTNGEIQSWTEFRVSLRPRNTGTLTIPEFRVGGAVSLPITVVVGDSVLTSSTANSEIFLTSSVSKEKIYVQEQLIYTIKLHYTISFDQGAQLTSPQIDNALVQQLGSDKSYQEIIEGIRYNVTERQFVVYPQVSGAMAIPPIYFSATVGRRRNGLSRMLTNRNSSAREINLTSEAYDITIKPTPASFSGMTWLPSSEISLEESWSTDLTALTVGEAVTRNIQLLSMGLSASLLPDLEYPEIQGVKFYPDQPVREDTIDGNGIIGSRTEGTAIVASTAGDIIIPEIRIPWWNTVTDNAEVAVIPARTLHIAALPSTGATDNTMTLNSIDPTGIIANNGQISSSGNVASAMTPASQTSGLYLVWIVATVLFASAWLATTFLWMRSRRLLAASRIGGYQDFSDRSGNAIISSARQKNARPYSNEKIRPNNLKGAFKALQTCCQQQHPKAIKGALIHWGNYMFINDNILTLEQLAMANENSGANSALNNTINDLKSALYSGNQDSTFNAEELLSAASQVQKYHKATKQKDVVDYSLPPLYKN